MTYECERIHQLQTQLENCEKAAVGETVSAPDSSYGWSRALDLVKDLYNKLEKERRYNSYLISAGRVRVDEPLLTSRIYDAVAKVLTHSNLVFPSGFGAWEVIKKPLCAALEKVEVPYERENGSRYNDRMEEFDAWRAGVDEDKLLDRFDLALGWFAGKGFSHDEALKAAKRAMMEGQGS